MDGQRAAASEEDVAWMHADAREMMGFRDDRAGGSRSAQRKAKAECHFKRAALRARSVSARRRVSRALPPISAACRRVASMFGLVAQLEKLPYFAKFIQLCYQLRAEMLNQSHFRPGRYCSADGQAVFQERMKCSLRSFCAR